MDITEDLLYERYSTMSTEDLVELYNAGGLTEMASKTLARVFSERKVTPEEIGNITELLKQKPLQQNRPLKKEDEFAESVIFPSLYRRIIA